MNRNDFLDLIINLDQDMTKLQNQMLSSLRDIAEEHEKRLEEHATKINEVLDISKKKILVLSDLNMLVSKKIDVVSKYVAEKIETLEKEIEILRKSLTIPKE
jgi:hypothetical protein